MTSNSVPPEPPVAVWTLVDFNEGKCKWDEVGQEKPIWAVSEVVPIEQTLTAMLAVHSKEAYIELGGKDYLKRNPSLLNKVLLRQVEGPVQRMITWESHTATFAELKADMPWIEERRLAYQVGSTIRADVKGLKDVDGSDVVEMVDGRDIEVDREARARAQESGSQLAKERGFALDLPTPPTASSGSPATDADGPPQRVPIPADPTLRPPAKNAATASGADIRKDYGPRGSTRH